MNHESGVGDMHLLFQFYRLKKKAAPRRAFRVLLWKKLSAEMRGAEVARPSFSFPQAFLRYAVAPVVAIVLFAGSGAYAYGNPLVNDAHPLYLLKRAIEKTEGAMARTPEEKTAYSVKLMNERLREANELIKNEKPIADTFARFSAAELAGVSAAQAVSAEKPREQFFGALDDALNLHTDLLEAERYTEPGDARRAIERIAGAQDALFDAAGEDGDEVETLLRKHSSRMETLDSLHLAAWQDEQDEAEFLDEVQFDVEDGEDNG